MGIYGSSNKPLNELLQEAGNQKDASLLIPDLQRPYVWRPDQVVLLIDSLIRGWPFGTLLLWNVKNEEISSIPSRTFWTVVDRTTGGKGASVTPQNPPARFRMVLDGQQRLQSLLLAVGGDDWGFKLDDQDWHSIRGTIPSKGKYAKGHWSKGQLCLDLEVFSDRYQAAGTVLSIDYREVLTWVTCSPNGGTDLGKRPNNYKQPLVRFDEKPGQFVRFSRLWDLAQPVAGIPESKYRMQLQPLLEAHGVPKERRNNVMGPLAELLVLLGAVKAAEVTFLELKAVDDAVMDRDEYNSAIVNIFTRLNTAGRTLTRSEITFAWIKSSWNTSHTKKEAYDCFESLRVDLGNLGLDMEMDELVRSISIVWSALFRDGELLKATDLLNGQTLKPMASDLARHWTVLSEAFVNSASLLQERGLKYGEHTDSLNAVIVISVWYSLAWFWLSQNPSAKTVQRDSLVKQINQCFIDHADRWLLVTQWAGRWRAAAGATFEAYIKDLSKDHKSISGITNTDEVREVLNSRITGWLQSCEKDAMRFIEGLSANQRQYVRQYYLPLWIWHRIDKVRWEMSEIPLRTNLKKQPAWEVDHVVSYKYWEDHLVAPTDDSTIEDFEEEVNCLGNCALLEKTFNIAKHKGTLEDFLIQVYEFNNNNPNKTDLDDWRKALDIDPALLNPSKHTAEEIRQAVTERTKRMKAELVEFIKGERGRHD